MRKWKKHGTRHKLIKENKLSRIRIRFVLVQIKGPSAYTWESPGIARCSEGALLLLPQNLGDLCQLNQTAMCLFFFLHHHLPLRCRSGLHESAGGGVAVVLGGAGGGYVAPVCRGIG